MEKRDVKSQLISRLTTVLRRLPSLVQIAKAIAEEIQELDDAAVDILLKRLITEASGIYLDEWGRVLGEPRRGREDDKYRPALFVRVSRNRSTGQTDEVVRVLKGIANTDSVDYLELPTAYGELYFFNSDGDSDRINRAVQESRQAGSRVEVIRGGGKVFTFANETLDNVQDPETQGGFGSLVAGEPVGDFVFASLIS